MKHNFLPWISLILVSLLILATFSVALSVQDSEPPKRKKVRKLNTQTDLTQTITDSVNLFVPSPSSAQGNLSSASSVDNQSSWEDPIVTSGTNTVDSYPLDDKGSRSSHCSRKITIRDSSIATPLINFPVLIILNSTIGAKCDEGRSIRFYDPSNTTEYSYEIETWNSTGDSYVWVKLPSLSSTSDTIMYLYYNNSGAIDGQNKHGVWNSNFALVQHMVDDTSLVIADSTSDSYNATKKGVNEPHETNGTISHAQYFDGLDDHADCAAPVVENNTKTVSLWMKDDANRYQVVLANGNGASGNCEGFSLCTDTSNVLQFILGNGGTVGHFLNLLMTLPDTTSWHYYAFTYDGVSLTGYIDNTTWETTSTTSGTESVPSTNLRLGNNPVSPSYPFQGALDELRILTTAVNRSWINASYVNQATPSSFVSIGDEMYSRLGIYFSAPSPSNGDVSPYTNPTLSITVINGNGSRMNITFKTNASGIWSVVGTNDSVGNGTYSQTPSSMISYDHHYWWSVNATDTEMNWENATYTFWTSPINTSVDPIVPYNYTPSPLPLNVTGNDDLSNVTLYYRYSPTNTTPYQYITSIEESDVFRNGVDSNYLNYPNQLDARDGSIYIASFLSKAFVIADATDQYHLTEKAHYQDTTYLNGCHDILVTHDQKYLYTLGYSSAYLCMWNISSLSTITRVKTIPLGETGMYMVMDDTEHFLYVTSTTNVRIYNITDKPSFQMNLLSTFHDNIPANTKIWHPTIDGTTLYITVRNSIGNANGYGINIYDVSNKSTPVYKNTLNSTIQTVKVVTYHHTNGFTYLIFAGYDYLGYRSGNLFIYNISAGNTTHPVFMYRENTMETNGNYTDSELTIIKNYIFVSKSNDNISTYKSGFYVYNISNMTIPPVYLTGMNGTGAPYYLKFCHEIALDDNGSARTVYMVTQDDDTLVSITPTWTPGYSDWSAYGGWLKYEQDTSYPWSFSFDFPNATGYYEFYSIGQKTGSSPEKPPLYKDAIVHYINSSVHANFTYTPLSPNDLDNVSFQDTSLVQEGSIIAWSWDFGDGNHSTLQNPIHNYGDEGNYMVFLTVTTTMGINDTIGKLVAVSNLPPTAQYTYTPVSPNIADLIFFTDLSSDGDGTIVNWTWDFGDESISYLPNPTHAYSETGLFPVVLRVTDDDNAIATLLKNITIHTTLLIPIFTYSPAIPTNGTIVHFMDTSLDQNGTITTWWWDFGDGYFSAMQNPSHTYYQEQVVNVSLTISDNNNLTATTTQTLTISPRNKTITRLQTSWNVISLQHTPPINTTDLLILYNGTTFNWPEATTNNNPTGGPLILDTIFGWNRTTQTYFLSDCLIPDSGYWVYAYHNCTLFRP